jgi:hypothetical protein
MAEGVLTKPENGKERDFTAEVSGDAEVDSERT